MAERSRTRRRLSQHGLPRPAADASQANQPRPAEEQQPDALIHERMRLGIVSALAANRRLSFSQLKEVLKTTDGNVSAHARRLEEAGYILAHKRFEGRVPRTEYELTDAGRTALERYLEHMEALIRSMRGR